MVENIFTLYALSVVQQGDQILDVGAGESECVDLGELSVGGISRHEFPQLVKSRIDCVHPFSLPAVGCYSLYFAVPTTRAFLVVAIRLHTVSIGAAAAWAPC